MSLRTGLVGTSRWATTVHGAAVNAHPDLDLTAVWGRDPDKAAGAAAALGAVASPSYGALVAEVDVVVLSVPPTVQGPLALQAAAAGKHLVLEKPLSLDPVLAKEIADAAGCSVLFVTRRWEPLTAGWLGELADAGGWDSGRAELVAALPQDLFDRSPWRAEHGGLWDVGPHALSALEAVLGPVADVRAARGRRDLVTLLLTHASGALSTADLCLTAAPEAAHTTFSFWGATGRSTEPPQLPADAVHHAAAAALTDLVAQVAGAPGRGLDAAYGAHLTDVLARAQRDLEG